MPVKVAASFLALSYLKQQTLNYAESAWAAIHAAWICDDKNKEKASKECRKKAISMIENANAHSQNMGDQAGKPKLSQLISCAGLVCLSKRLN